ncbi:MAG TPA: methylmalonyl-CoA mutase family protein [Candidatus Baltobacteraceae bacterium]|jgi:methylmalonyl-CoA mutase N-terminal domain/subunit|nr:methylmalonyl-CoA mutase family protein [Candidatus Baltobacteraceae bacterium]
MIQRPSGLGAEPTDEFVHQKEQWEAASSRGKTRKGPGSGAVDRTISDLPLKTIYGPQDVSDLDLAKDLSWPGQFPYTRGIHPNMYRDRLWTMRQFAGFGNARQTNERYHFLLAHGQHGLSVAFDMPTLMGYDSDASAARGEVGKCGVAIDSLADMETLFDGIDMGEVTTSMTINGPAAIALAQYVAAAEKKGIPRAKLGGTIQADILKEYIAQKEWIFPPRPHMRVIVDMMRFCRDEMPKWNTISISGYHIREAGSTAVQELAFTLADGFAYVEAGIKAGMDVDSFAPRLSFFFNAHIDFFEEICKYRAARKIWARHMREKYGAKDPRSWQLRFHTQTAGCSATAQQPENNIVRVAYEAMAAVLGGTQSLHTNSMDEVLALPTQKSVEIALRTQQVLAYETNVTNVVDPLGGSYFVESLTAQMEQQAEEYFAQIAEYGGVIEAIEAGFFQREIADASYRYQRSLETKDRVIVGVNAFEKPEDRLDIELLRITEEIERGQAQAVQEVRHNRDQSAVSASLDRLKQACNDPADNLMPHLIDCVNAYATEGEIVNAMVEVYGRYTERAAF